MIKTMKLEDIKLDGVFNVIYCEIGKSPKNVKFYDSNKLLNFINSNINVNLFIINDININLKEIRK